MKLRGKVHGGGCFISPASFCGFALGSYVHVHVHVLCAYCSSIVETPSTLTWTLFLLAQVEQCSCHLSRPLNLQHMPIVDIFSS
jgi:hypothetical protein